MISTPSIPEQLAHVPERFRVAETFGWQPGIWGAFFLIVACCFAESASSSPAAGYLPVMLPSAALGLGLAGYEIWRHKNRTVLVMDGGRIAVFRKGRLDLVLEPDRITRVKADFVTMIKIGVPLSLVAVLFTFLGIDFITRGKAVIDGLMVLSLAMACWGSMASAAWTRFRCAHLRIPIKGSKWTEESVLVPLSMIKDLSVG